MTTRTATGAADEPAGTYLHCGFCGTPGGPHEPIVFLVAAPWRPDAGGGCDITVPHCAGCHRRHGTAGLRALYARAATTGRAAERPR